MELRYGISRGYAVAVRAPLFIFAMVKYDNSGVSAFYIVLFCLIGGSMSQIVDDGQNNYA